MPNKYARKYNHAFVKNAFESDGYQLLSNEKYKNPTQKFQYMCPNGHNGEISWGSWCQASRCRVCYIEKSRNNIKDIKSTFRLRGYTLLSIEYKNANLRLDYMCPNNHKNSMSWSNFRNGSECPTCVDERNANNLRLPFDKVKESFEKEGYELLTKTYINANQKLEFRCKKGHEHSMPWAKWNSGVRCIYCFQESNFGDGNPNWRNGLSKSPYCSVWRDKEFKEYLIERDKDKLCWNPQCPGIGEMPVFHHIDYKKSNCNPMNVIKICNSCNSIANFNRNWWQAFYNEIMRRRFNNAK